MATNKTSKKGQEEARKTSPKKGGDKAGAKKAASKNASKKASSRNKKNGKPSIFTRMKKFFGSIRSEMKRVTWPSRKELINYSVAVIVSLVLVGVVIAVLDMVIGEGLAFFAGLRG